MTLEEKVSLLMRVELFSGLDESALVEIAEQVRLRRYTPGQRIVSELEFGADVFVVASGRAQVSVCPQVGSSRVLGELSTGDIFGEMASLSGELRSATVVCLTRVEVLVLSDQLFDRLRLQYPEIAVALVRTLVTRLTEAEVTLAGLLESHGASTGMVETEFRRSSVSLLWRQLVISHRKELPFLTLAAFAITLVVIRLIVYLTFFYEFASREVLRIAYVTGFALVILSACAAVLTFRPTWRRGIALAFGVGTALIVNELGVTLAFDIFYKDIFTPDPTLAFNVERLYRRTEPMRAIAVVFALLLQAVYLKTFYLRLCHFAKIRLLYWVKGR